jgi:hypothetical protein
MREPSYFTREEYALTKVALAREEVPAEAFALFSAWIEGERLLVDDREDVGGITFCRMDAKVMAPLPHIVASFFARRPYKRKAGHYPRWNGFYLLLYRDYVVSEPSEETWPEQALLYAIAFKPPADWSLDEQMREFALPGAEPQ